MTAPKRAARGATTGIRGVESSPRPSLMPNAFERYQPGELIGDKYELKHPVGRGGMGTVWVAHNVVLDVDVGIKLIALEGRSGDLEGLAQRLLDEARSAARLDHAAIVRVNDFGRTRFGDPFLAMELLSGEDLGERIGREGRLEPVLAVQVLLPILHALAVAHERNIIHRDVKPENIFLAKDAKTALQPKLLDFGIARMVDRPRNLTVEGAVMGTPDYMSPEQACGQVVGPATDQFSICVVLYELLAGRLPFDAPNYHALLRAIVDDPPPRLAELGVDEPHLAAVVERGLAKAPEERWPSVRDLGEQLARWLLDRGIGDDITGSSLQRTWFRDPNSDSWSDVSTLSHLPDDVQEAIERVRRERVGRPASSRSVSALQLDTSSQPELMALVELDRLDPEQLFGRFEARRRALYSALFVLATLVLALSLLVSADVIRW